MHQNGTADKSCGTTGSVLPGVAALLLLGLFLWRIASLLSVSPAISALLLTVALLFVSALLSITALLSVATLTLIARAGIVECAFAGLLIHEKPPVVAGIPLGEPRRGDWWGALLLALLLSAVLALACEVTDNAVEEAHCV